MRAAPRNNTAAYFASNSFRYFSTSRPRGSPSSVLLYTDQGQIDEPRLWRDESPDLRTHRARVQIVDNIKPGRVVDETFMGLAIGRRDCFGIGGLRNRLEGGVEFVVLPLLEIEAVRGKIGG